MDKTYLAGIRYRPIKYVHVLTSSESSLSSMFYKYNYAATHICASSTLITCSVHFAVHDFIILTTLGEEYKLRKLHFSIGFLFLSLYKNCFSHYILKHTEFVFIHLRKAGHVVA
jgi:hypothetical protein